MPSHLLCPSLHFLLVVLFSLHSIKAGSLLHTGFTCIMYIVNIMTRNTIMLNTAVHATVSAVKHAFASTVRPDVCSQLHDQPRCTLLAESCRGLALPGEAKTMACATRLLYPSTGTLMVTPSIVHVLRPCHLAVTLTAALRLQKMSERVQNDQQQL